LNLKINLVFDACGCGARALETQSVDDEVSMLDLFYVAIVLAFFGLLWGFTKAAERL
jgi:hypothetical protein